MKTLALLLLMSFPVSAETVIQVHGLSYHVDRGANYNEINQGFAIRHYGYSGFDYISVGQYKNSIYKTSRYAIIGWEKPISDNIALGLVVGVVDGYGDHAVPMIAPVVTLWNRMHVFSAPIPTPVIEVSFDIVRF